MFQHRAYQRRSSRQDDPPLGRGEYAVRSARGQGAGQSAVVRAGQRRGEGSHLFRRGGQGGGARRSDRHRRLQRYGRADQCSRKARKPRRRHRDSPRGGRRRGRADGSQRQRRQGAQRLRRLRRGAAARSRRARGAEHPVRRRARSSAQRLRQKGRRRAAFRRSRRDRLHLMQSRDPRARRRAPVAEIRHIVSHSVRYVSPDEACRNSRLSRTKIAKIMAFLGQKRVDDQQNRHFQPVMIESAYFFYALEWLRQIRVLCQAQNFIFNSFWGT